MMHYTYNKIYIGILKKYPFNNIKKVITHTVDYSNFKQLGWIRNPTKLIVIPIVQSIIKYYTIYDAYAADRTLYNSCSDSAIPFAKRIVLFLGCFRLL